MVTTQGRRRRYIIKAAFKALHAGAYETSFCQDLASSLGRFGQRTSRFLFRRQPNTPGAYSHPPGDLSSAFYPSVALTHSAYRFCPSHLVPEYLQKKKESFPSDAV